MGIFFDSPADKARRKKQQEERAKASHKSSGGSLLSWGNPGREQTHASFWELGPRVTNDQKRENAKTGFFGFGGSAWVSEKAKRAQKGQSRGRSNRNKSWWT